MFHNIDIKTEPGHEVFLPFPAIYRETLTSESEKRFLDYQNKCRCCFESFSISSTKISIDLPLMNTFRDLTGVELLQGFGYSMFFCYQCSSNIKKCQEFIEKSRNLQNQFNEFVSFKPVIKAEIINEQDVTLCEVMLAPGDDSIKPEDESNCIRDCSVKLKRVDIIDVEEYNISSKQAAKKKARSRSDSRKNLTKERMSCDKCEWSTLSKKRLLFHVLKHVQPVKLTNKLSCKYCRNISKSTKGLHEHIKRSHKQEKFDKFCKICNTGCESNFRLERHLEMYHPDSEKHKCGNCEKSFYTEETLKRHDELTHKVSVKCKELSCMKLFFDKYTMTSHYYRMHLEQRKVSQIDFYLNLLIYHSQSFISAQHTMRSLWQNLQLKNISSHAYEKESFGRSNITHL